MRIALISLLIASPALAQQTPPDDPLAPIGQDSESPPPEETSPSETTPVVVTPVIAVPRDWREEFAAIRSSHWAEAQAGIAALPDGPIKPVARAELYLAKGSPKAELAPLLALIAEAPDLPQADQLQRMAVARGAFEPPRIAYEKPIVFLGASPRRQKSRPVSGDPLADPLRIRLDPLVKADNAEDADLTLVANWVFLTSEARAEAAQRVAWIYYVRGNDFDTRRVADAGRAGARGEWGGQAAWISGLAAWRMGDCKASQAAFADTARMTSDRELGAAAAYWGARSAQACRRPREVEALMMAAARSPDSFYGLVARETLGMSTRLPAPTARNAGVASRPNVVRARELLAIGERAQADAMLHQQARTGPESEHRDLALLAGTMGLPGTQYWLAHNGPRGAQVDLALRFPTMHWAPSGGWRVDPALCLAHARQESDFRTAVVSPAGAVGLMQVRPGTAGDVARARGVPLGILTDPATNLEYGQSFIELLRGKGATRGQLPKVIAAYNAGPLPVDRWNSINDKGDPLLWVESLPYWETRYYVPSVLRNMFVYQGLSGEPQPELKAIAEHKWPAFPAARAYLGANITR